MSLARLHTDIAAALRAADICAGVTVEALEAMSEQGVATVTDILNKALGGMLPRDGMSGLAVLVLLPGFAPQEPDAPGPQGRVTVVLQIIENTTVNGGSGGVGRSAFVLGHDILRFFHHRSLNGAGVIFADELGLQPMSIDETVSADVGYELTLALPVGVRPLARALAPVATLADGLITLMASESGSAVYYTTDGSYPVGGALYAAPFAAPPAGSVVRAVAVVTGKEHSSITEIEI